MAEFSSAVVVLVALEGLQQDCRVAIFVEADLVEIVVADVDVQVLAPIVLDPLVDDSSARLERLDAVGTGAERRLERRLRDVALLAVRVLPFPPMLREDLELAHDVRQLAIARAVEGEGHLALAGDFSLCHVAVVEAGVRIVLDGLLEAPDHVLRGHRLAVVPAGLRAAAGR